ncbi:MAG: hypothetical protein Kow0090_14330 [Myxococcota bacterium]
MRDTRLLIYGSVLAFLPLFFACTAEEKSVSGDDDDSSTALLPTSCAAWEEAVCDCYGNTHLMCKYIGETIISSGSRLNESGLKSYCEERWRKFDCASADVEKDMGKEVAGGCCSPSDPCGFWGDDLCDCPDQEWDKRDCVVESECPVGECGEFMGGNFCVVDGKAPPGSTLCPKDGSKCPEENQDRIEVDIAGLKVCYCLYVCEPSGGDNDDDTVPDDDVVSNDDDVADDDGDVVSDDDDVVDDDGDVVSDDDDVVDDDDDVIKGGCELKATPAAVEFGKVALGVKELREVVVKNAGDSPCVIVEIVNPALPNFTIESASSGSFELAPAESFAITVGFEPSETKFYEDSISIIEIVPENELAMIPLRGEGFQPSGDCKLEMTPPYADASKNPALLDFGIVEIGKSLTKYISFTNIGAKACAIANGYFSNTIDPDFKWEVAPAFPTEVGVGKTVEFGVTITPTKEGIIGDVNLNDPYCMFFPDSCKASWAYFKTSDSEEPGPYISGGFAPIYPAERGFVVILKGEGILSLEKVLVPVPAALDFGKVKVDCETPARVIKIYNNGKSAIKITGVDIDSPFEIIGTSPDTGSASIASGAYLEVSLIFAPDSVGVESADLIVEVEGEGLRVPVRGEGVSGGAVTDYFTQANDVKTDVLWVIDNSGSMSEEQTAIKNNLNAFFARMASLNVDYQFGVTTTEINEANESGSKPGTVPGHLFAAPGYPKIIKPTTPDPINAASANVDVGTCCSDEQEAGLQAAYLALSEPIISDPNANAGFLRKDSRIAVIIVSDEEDQSNGSVQFYAEFLRSLRGFNKDLVSLSIIVGLSTAEPPMPLDCSSVNGDAVAAHRYHEAFLNVDNGYKISICLTDWKTILEKLAEKIFKGQREFSLSSPASSSSIRVYINGSQVTSGWSYVETSNSILFSETTIPKSGDSISASYNTVCN